MRQSRGDQSYNIFDVQRVFATVTNNGNETKILVVNDSYNSKSISINSSGLSEIGQKLFVSASKYDKIYADSITTTDNTIVDNIDPRSINLYSFSGKVILSNNSKRILDTKINIYPNPFNKTTTINFTCSKSINKGSIKIYNPLGQLVKILVDHASFETGNHIIQWDGTNVENMPLPSGIYVIVLQADSFIQSRIVTLLK